MPNFQLRSTLQLGVAVRQSGFTLVEMGMVLAIIGFILTGILGGQSLIRSARVNDVVAIVEDLRTASTLFKQRFNYLPGDFPAAAGDIPGVLMTGNGNGQIGGAGNVTDGTGIAVAGTEVAWAPLHLFNAGLIGKVDSGQPLRMISTSYGGVHLVSSVIAGALVPANAPAPGFVAANPTARNAIVFYNLPCDVAREVDLKIDDGNGLTGRAVGNFTAAGACPANDIIDWYAVAL